MNPWRLPASGAGPSPDRLILGSEGTLGIITEAWMRLQEKPAFKSAASVTFTSFGDALRGLRSIAQSDLHPANCRLLDPGEAALVNASHDGSAVLILGFESAHAPVDQRLGQAIELARSHHGHAEDPATEPGTPADAAADAWRIAFLRMPYLRDALARMGAIVETFETAVTWDRLPQLIDAVRTEVGNAAHVATGHPATINCRITHVYPDGAAPYFTVLAVSRPAPKSPSGTNSKRLPTKCCTATKPPSPTTTPSDATTARHTTASAPTCSRPRSEPRKTPWIPTAFSTRDS